MSKQPIVLHFDVPEGLISANSPDDLIDHIIRAVNAGDYLQLRSFDGGVRYLSPHHVWHTTVHNIRAFQRSDFGLSKQEYNWLIRAQDQNLPVTVLCVAVDGECSSTRYYDVEVPTPDGKTFTVNALAGYHLTEHLDDLHS
jgi:hypothetical protein